ncbi:hypothetical protein N7539_004143 [Penicillium diatomitis]|uniref:Uncharacterized protein n=1 Tax=Penicillium diatomitis TaxID=2819901 RepID=A0A9X0BYC9_9EURO|nr:uncharacterized protein N7539_004143 [Penicillium diatomitis]KAJ5489253.1 hypothetical protein N7539_004143 [Penicillium diatomitis]
MVTDYPSPAISSKKTPVTVWVFFALAALDIAVNAAAGPAAVATAVHVSGDKLTARSLQLGALAGVTKAGVLAFVEFVSYTGIPAPAWLVLILFASSFGICVLVTAEISNLVLGETPSALLIAAIVAAIPLGGECIGIYQFHRRSTRITTDQSLHVLAAGGLSGGNGGVQIFVMGLDALGGYVFARMAHNEGYDICAYNVAAAAGAVYGAITGIFHTGIGCMAGAQSTISVNGHYETTNIFGTRKGYDENWRTNAGLI